MERNEAHVRYTPEQYDEYTAQFVAPFDDFLAQPIVAYAANYPQGMILLDIGTGTARFLVYLAKMPELNQVRLVGTDLFADMIETGRKAVSTAGLSNRIELLVQDVHQMDLPDEYAEIIISRSTIHHWSNPPLALQEIYRLLKPRGKAIIHDVRRDPAPGAIAEFNRLRALAGLAPSYLDEKFTTSEVKEFVRQAGIAAYAEVHSTDKGLAALGFALEITKP